MSVMPATAVSDWPTPTVSMMIHVEARGLAHQHRLAGLFGHAAQAACRGARAE